MADLGTLVGASPVDASNNSYLNFTDDLTEVQTSALGNTPADLGNVDTLSWQIEYSLKAARDDDTYALNVRIVNGATILAAADSGGTFSVVSAGVTSTADTTSPVTAFAYINTAASKALWDGASIELQQVYSKSKGSDVTGIRIDYAAFTGTYSLGAQAHSIVGAQTVATTTAATLDFTRNASIVGAQTVTATPAATLDYQLHAALGGAQTITLTPAATMSYAIGGVNHSINGSQTIAQSVNATLDYRQHLSIIGAQTIGASIAATTTSYTLNADIIGSQTVVVGSAATLDFTRHADIVGSQSVTVTPSATLNYSVGGVNHSIIGSQTIAQSVSATLDYQRHAGLIGSLAVDVLPASATDFTSNAAIVGDASITVSPSALFNFGGAAQIVGNSSINVLPASTSHYTLNASIIGDSSVSVAVNSSTALGRSLVGSSHIVQSVNSAMQYSSAPKAIIGSITITSAVLGVTAYIRRAVITGNVPIQITPSAVFNVPATGSRATLAISGDSGEITLSADNLAISQSNAAANITLQSDQL